ncbi:MAG: outer membrane beta-barrel protein, partial [Bacteroidales bacterium]|nr:outer membrane beta-barrel protein [Candidatus Cryptobacteroides fimicaballi]
YINCNSDLKTGLNLSLKISPVKWFDATLSANTFYTDTKGYFENIDIDNRGWSNRSNLLLNFLPFRNTDIQLQYFLSSPQYYPQFTTAFNHYMNIGIKQTLCKGALTLSATATDVFGTDKWEIHSSNRIFTLDNTSLRKSRMIWLGISYNFNSFKQQKNQKKQEEDRSRLNLGL